MSESLPEQKCVFGDGGDGGGRGGEGRNWGREWKNDFCAYFFPGQSLAKISFLIGR